jgi:hypothetical protein
MQAEGKYISDMGYRVQKGASIEERKWNPFDISYYCIKLQTTRKTSVNRRGTGKLYKGLYKELRRNGGIVNADIVSSAAIGIIKKHDSNLLQCNGGHIVCNREWAKNFLRRLGYVKRRANTKSKVTVEHFEMYNLFTTLK